MSDTKRTTIQRELVLDALKALNIHATAEQIYDHVIRKHPSISKSTVYRNLSQMAEAGEILNIGNFFGAAHYDHNTHSHYHFICEECHKVFDIQTHVPDLCHSSDSMNGFHIRSHNLTFSGLCPDCNTLERERTGAST